MGIFGIRKSSYTQTALGLKENKIPERYDGENERE